MTDALDRVSDLMLSCRPGEAEALAQMIAKETTNPAERAQALISRCTALLNLGRTEEMAEAVVAAFEAVRSQQDPCLHGQLNALAAHVAYREDALDRAVRHLVAAMEAMNATTVLDSWAACGWNDLAMAYSYLGFHGYAMSAYARMREVAAAAGISEERVVAPGIRLRNATWRDHQGDTDACVRILRDIVAELKRRDRESGLDGIRPSALAGYAYAAARLGALGQPTDVEVVALFSRGGQDDRSRELRALGEACEAIAGRRSIEALARLDTMVITPDALGPAEVPRLRALAHLRAGNHKAAYEADRIAFRIAAANSDRLREVYVQATYTHINNESLVKTVEQYAGAALTDPLTGLPNRRAFERHVNMLVERGEPAIIGVCDMDGFKAVNTVHGHLAGDRVLHRIGKIIERVMRRDDFVARYGGDEFVVVLPSTSLDEAAEVARRIVTAVATEDWRGMAPGTPIGVSVGWAEVTGLQSELRSALTKAFEAADRAMLSAKPRARAS